MPDLCLSNKYYREPLQFGLERTNESRMNWVFILTVLGFSVARYLADDRSAWIHDSFTGPVWTNRRAYFYCEVNWWKHIALKPFEHGSFQLGTFSEGTDIFGSVALHRSSTPHNQGRERKRKSSNTLYTYLLPQDTYLIPQDTYLLF